MAILLLSLAISLFPSYSLAISVSPSPDILQSAVSPSSSPDILPPSTSPNVPLFTPDGDLLGMEQSPLGSIMPMFTSESDTVDADQLPIVSVIPTLTSDIGLPEVDRSPDLSAIPEFEVSTTSTPSPILDDTSINVTPDLGNPTEISTTPYQSPESFAISTPESSQLAFPSPLLSTEPETGVATVESPGQFGMAAESPNIAIETPGTMETPEMVLKPVESAEVSMISPDSSQDALQTQEIVLATAVATPEMSDIPVESPDILRVQMSPESSTAPIVTESPDVSLVAPEMSPELSVIDSPDVDLATPQVELSTSPLLTSFSSPEILQSMLPVETSPEPTEIQVSPEPSRIPTASVDAESSSEPSEDADTPEITNEESEVTGTITSTPETTSEVEETLVIPSASPDVSPEAIVTLEISLQPSTEASSEVITTPDASTDVSTVIETPSVSIDMTPDVSMTPVEKSITLEEPEVTEVTDAPDVSIQISPVIEMKPDFSAIPIETPIISEDPAVISSPGVSVDVSPEIVAPTVSTEMIPESSLIPAETPIVSEDPAVISSPDVSVEMSPGIAVPSVTTEISPESSSIPAETPIVSEEPLLSSIALETPDITLAPNDMIAQTPDVAESMSPEVTDLPDQTPLVTAIAIPSRSPDIFPEVTLTSVMETPDTSISITDISGSPAVESNPIVVGTPELSGMPQVSSFFVAPEMTTLDSTKSPEMILPSQEAMISEEEELIAEISPVSTEPVEPSAFPVSPVLSGTPEPSFMFVFETTTPNAETMFDLDVTVVPSAQSIPEESMDSLSTPEPSAISIPSPPSETLLPSAVVETPLFTEPVLDTPVGTIAATELVTPDVTVAGSEEPSSEVRLAAQSPEQSMQMSEVQTPEISLPFVIPIATTPGETIEATFDIVQTPEFSFGLSSTELTSVEVGSPEPSMLIAEVQTPETSISAEVSELEFISPAVSIPVTAQVTPDVTSDVIPIPDTSTGTLSFASPSPDVSMPVLVEEPSVSLSVMQTPEVRLTAESTPLIEEVSISPLSLFTVTPSVTGSVIKTPGIEEIVSSMVSPLVEVSLSMQSPEISAIVEATRTPTIDSSASVISPPVTFEETPDTTDVTFQSHEVSVGTTLASTPAATRTPVVGISEPTEPTSETSSPVVETPEESALASLEPFPGITSSVSVSPSTIGSMRQTSTAEPSSVMGASISASASITTPFTEMVDVTATVSEEPDLESTPMFTAIPIPSRSLKPSRTGSAAPSASFPDGTKTPTAFPSPLASISTTPGTQASEGIFEGTANATPSVSPSNSAMESRSTEPMLIVPPTVTPLPRAEACLHAWEECDIKFMADYYGPTTYDVTLVPPDTGFSNVMEGVLVANTNGLVPELIDDVTGVATKITELGLVASAIKPFGNRIGAQALQSKQRWMLAGRCVRVYFTHLLLVDGSNVDFTERTHANCAVFRFK